MAFPDTWNRFTALSSALELSEASAGGPVKDFSSPLLKVIWGRILDVRASRSVVIADCAMARVSTLWASKVSGENVELLSCFSLTN